jgi:LacI family transcriptional regulator
MDLETILQADAEGACAATRYLLEMGHRRIGCIVGRDDTTSGRERRVGYIRAYHEYGLVPDPQLIFAGPYEPETGFRGSSYLMNLSPRPTALFVANQEAAMGVIKFLSDHDTKIPDELSLICYENIPWLQWQKPAISIVDNNSQTIADLAVDGLMRRLSQVSDPLQPAEPPRNLRVEARLVLRDSCTPPRLQE